MPALWTVSVAAGTVAVVSAGYGVRALVRACALRNFDYSVFIASRLWLHRSTPVCVLTADYDDSAGESPMPGDNTGVISHVDPGKRERWKREAEEGRGMRRGR